MTMYQVLLETSVMYESPDYEMWYFKDKETAETFKFILEKAIKVSQDRTEELDRLCHDEYTDDELDELYRKFNNEVYMDMSGIDWFRVSLDEIELLESVPDIKGI